MFDSSPLIKVRWKDHASIMVSNFIKLLQHDEFADVQICHAGRTIAAHRTMLAASSQLFCTRLASAAAAVTAVELDSLQCINSLLVAKGADAVFADLELIIQIVYRGWVELRERCIGSLLETARCLQFTDVCVVLQRTMQTRANAQHVQQLTHHPQHLQQTLLPQTMTEAECLEHLDVTELSLGTLQEVMLTSEPTCLLAPEITELAHLTPLAPMAVDRRPDPPPPSVLPLSLRQQPSPPPPSPATPQLPLPPPPPPSPSPLAPPPQQPLLPPPPPPAPPPPLPPHPPPSSGLRHEDAALLTAASLCEVVHQPPVVELAHEPTLLPASGADGSAAGIGAEPADQEQHQNQDQNQSQNQNQDQSQQRGQHQYQGRPHGAHDSAPLLRVRTPFELYCPWGVDMEQARRKRHEPEQGSSMWSGISMPAPRPPPPAPPSAAAAAAAPLLPDAGDGSDGLVAEEEQAIIDRYGLPPSTPETLERFDENDFSGLTEEEKSPMPPKTARVRRFRRRATPRVRSRKLPELISLDQSTVCQVCHLDLGRMAKLQRHLAKEHGDRLPAATAAVPAAATSADERPPASTVDVSAIANASDTCAGLLSFRTRLTAQVPAVAGAGAAAETEGRAVTFGGEEPRTDSGLTVEGTTPSAVDGGGSAEVRLSMQWPLGKTVLEADAGLAAEVAVPAARQSGESGLGPGVVPGRTVDGARWPDASLVSAATLRQEDDETPPLVIEEQRQGECSWTTIQQQEQQTGQLTTAAVDQASKFKCVECSFSTDAESLLRAHTRREHRAPLVCPHCQLQFRQAAALYSHVANTHPGVPDRLSQCLLCSYRSARPSQVRRHLRDVHGQDAQGRRLPLDYRCQQCDFATCSALKLREHERRKHTTDKEFKCSECSYSSVEKQALFKHFRIMHTDERPYRCEICDFRTKTLSRITRHRRSHTQERPHVCSTCDQRYADLRRLREHELRVHHKLAPGAEPLPFSCPFCSSKFGRRDNLRQHISKKHQDKAGVAIF